MCETSLTEIENTITKENPKVAVIDSIQTMCNEEISSAPGSVSQVRESTSVLMQLAKKQGKLPAADQAYGRIRPFRRACGFG